MSIGAVVVAAAATAAVLLIGATCCSAAPIPIIFNTDLGNDFDDQWTLSLALADPAFDIKLVLTASHDTVAKAQSVARMLYESGRLDVPLGIGDWRDNATGPNPTYAVYGRYFSLDDFVAKGGTLYRSGLAKAVEIIDAAHAAGAPVTWLGIAPMTNEGALARVHPESAKKVRLVSAMGGAFRVCYGHRMVPPRGCAEYNIADSVASSRAMLGAPWPILLSPLDLCDGAQVKGEQYQRLLKANATQPHNAVLRTLLALFCLTDAAAGDAARCREKSNTLFDATSLYLIKTLDTVVTSDMRLSVAANGTLGVAAADDGGAKLATVAMAWRDGGNLAWQRDVVDTLIASPHVRTDT